MTRLITAMTLTGLFSTAALADQCQLISAAEANRAVMLLQTGADFMEVCKPCGGGVTRKEKIRTITLSEEDVYSEIMINGKAIDLAYSYVKVAPRRYVNIAAATSCSTLDATTVDAVINERGYRADD